MFQRYITGEIPVPDPITIYVSSKQCISVYPVAAAFDIETTNDEETKAAYMYHWQFALADNVFAGRTWDDFFLLIDYLTQSAYYSKGILYVFIHNMDFEATFLIPRLYNRGLIKRVFAKSQHDPLEIELTNGIIFRDTAALTNMSLAALAKNYTKTQKLKGDLDYKIKRNSSTPLTEAEKQYCINDVVILKEYAEQLHAEYTLNRLKIPLTSTGIVRQYIKTQIPVEKRWPIKKSVQKLFPKTLKAYQNAMRYLFRGGYTHAQTGACDQILHDVTSYDLTSAYPSVMIHNVYPMTEFHEVYDPTTERIEKMISDGKAVLFTVEFTNIRARGAHCYESKHKLIDFSRDQAVFENGRLYRAAKATVLITEVDYEIYKMVYDWDKIEIINARYAHKARLPEYLYRSVLEFYRNKQELKLKCKEIEKSLEYAANDPHATEADVNILKDCLSNTKKMLMKAKGMLNSTYGMCVSRLNFGTWTYGSHVDPDTEEEVIGWYEEDGQTYETQTARQVLSPYWGIYVTAYTRLRIMKALCHFDEYALYSDTDSVKILNTAPGMQEYFDSINAEIRERNRVICERYQLPYELYADLGTFDCEGTYDRFKTLGAKRYIYEKHGLIEAVIAGLPKSATDQFVEKFGPDAMFRKFRDGMWFEYADKNAHHYAAETSAVIDGERMHEYASCYIYETSFGMTIEPVFISQIAERKEKFKNATI